MACSAFRFFRFRTRTGLAACLAAVAGWLSMPVAPALADRPPNVVLVYADDLGYGDLGCYGSTRNVTPHLDRLAREGMRFTQFYSAQAVCSASRTALLTGRYPNRVGILGALGPKAEQGIADAEWTLGEVFKSRGYATAVFGKWHLGHLPRYLPARHGFDEYFGLPYSNDMTAVNRPEWPDLPLIDGERVSELNPDQNLLTRRYAERAIAFIDRNRERPFFLYVPHTMPHVPLGVSAEFAGRTGRGAYADVLAEIDWSVGQILAALDEHGLADDTLVLFASDNGPWLVYGDHAGSAGGLREGKGTTFEGGVRVPCLARWPGHVPAGAECSEPSMTIDVLPTLAKIVGAETPTGVRHDGASMLPLLLGEPGAKGPHESLLFFWNRELQAVRSGAWKLHLPHEYVSLVQAGAGGQRGKTENRRIELSLFDLASDPAETTNVANQHADVVARLRDFAEQAQAELPAK